MSDCYFMLCCYKWSNLLHAKPNQQQTYRQFICFHIHQIAFMMEWYGVIIVLTSYVGRLLHRMQAIMHVAVFLM